MGDHALTPPNYHRLGEPLPHQLANSTHAHPPPINLYSTHHAVCRDHPVLIPVSRGYPSVGGRLRTRYSPVRRFPAAEAAFSLDLHVLSLPLAFILSQDQTLHCKVLNHSCRSSNVYGDLTERRAQCTVLNFKSCIQGHSCTSCVPSLVLQPATAIRFYFYGVEPRLPLMSKIVASVGPLAPPFCRLSPL